jgi:hypothetical protein
MPGKVCDCKLIFMVFYRLASGLLAGLTIPVVCNENVYLVIATSFLRPHLKYRMDAEKRNKNLAVRTDELDAYLKDIFKSALFFLIVIGPVLYKVYVKGEKEFFKQSESMDNELLDPENYKVEDRAVTLL